MKKVLIILILSLALGISAHAQSTWQLVNSPVQSADKIAAICATDYNTIIIGTYEGDMYKSENHGDTWQIVYNGSNISGDDFVIKMFGSIGYAFNVPNRILKTVDGGNTWTTFNIPNFPMATQFKPIDENTFYFSTDNKNELQRIYKYSDGNVNVVFDVIQWNCDDCISKRISIWNASTRYAYIYCWGELPDEDANKIGIGQMFSIDLNNDEQLATAIFSPIPTSIFAFEEGKDLMLGYIADQPFKIYSSTDGFQTIEDYEPSSDYSGWNNGMIGLGGASCTKLANDEVVIAGKHPATNLAQVMTGTILLSQDIRTTWVPESRLFNDVALGEQFGIWFEDVSSYDNTYFVASSAGILSLALPASMSPQVPDILNVEINQPESELEQGATFQFEAIVEVVNGADESVTWSLEGNESNATYINEDGLLSIATDETATLLVVAATSNFNPDVKAFSTVRIKATETEEDDENEDDDDDDGDPVDPVSIGTYVLNEISVYPNPAQSELRIASYELREGNSVEIYDMMGKLQQSTIVNMKSAVQTIDISALSNGNYLVKIVTGDGIISRKLVVNR